MLTNVHFAGIKSLLDVSVDLEPFTVLVGPNGCGKSTLLDQIELLAQITGAESTGHVLGAAGEVLKTARRDILATRLAGSGRAFWELTTDTGASARVTVDALAARAWYETGEFVVRKADGTQVALPRTSRGPDGLDEFDLARAEAAQRAQRLALNPHAIAVPVDVRWQDLQPDGTGLPAVLGRLLRYDRPAFDAVERDLGRVVTQFERLNIVDNDIPSGKGTTGGFGLELVMRGAGPVPASACSDGTLLALALLTAAHNRHLPSLILMDDIDHGLHLGAQISLLSAIRAVMAVRPELQVICTTHSPYFLHDVKVEEVRVMTLTPDGRTVVKPLAAHPEIARWRTAMSAGELWANLGEDWVLGS